MKKNYELSGMSCGGCVECKANAAANPGCYKCGNPIESANCGAYHE